VLSVLLRAPRREGISPDIVGDRHRLLLIGMAAVGGACVVFAASRLAVAATSGLLTPWWVNATGAVIIAVLYLWYRSHPENRSVFAAHATALVATGALLVPLAYGMVSTIWWLSLVGFAMVLLGRRREAWVWGVAIPVLVTVATFAEGRVRVPRAAGEPAAEYVLARIVFVVLVVAIAAAFRKVANQRAVALYQSEERFHRLSDSAFEGIAITDQGTLVDVNARLSEMLRCAPENLIGRSALDFIAPEARELVSAHFRSGAEDTYEHMMVRADGSTFLAEVQGRPLPYGAKTLRVTAIRDVTERRHTEQTLRMQTAALESAADAIAITDSKGSIVWVNQAFSALSGYSISDVIGENPRLLKSGVQDDPFYRQMWQTITAGHVWHGELVNRRKDGSLWQEEMTITPVPGEGGRIAYFIAIKRNVTEQRQLEAQLRHSQKMEAVGQLAGGVAHDFNNVLQAMVAQLALLRSSRPEPSPMSSTIDELERQVRRGASLTRQLLLFSRRETTRRELFNINDVVGEAADMLRRLVRENINLVVEPAASLLPAEADRAQVEQVLMNLAVNASDAMPNGGTLTIRTGGGDGHVWFSVEDTGCGIPEAIRDRIFEPFFTTKGPAQGTGLGLSVVHGIVTKHGGTILFQSEAGRGTIFRVKLPRAEGLRPEAESEPVVAADAQPFPGYGERVLVVEDEPGAREGLAQVLTMLGYQVTAVGTGGAAAALPEASPFDLLLTDLVLPDVAGVDLIETLLDRWPNARVILMSGYSEDEALRQLISAGLVRFLQKPFDTTTLAREIRGALDQIP
jgi:two-component system cell cycle sensor histidine kinase/response regulator CckA